MRKEIWIVTAVALILIVITSLIFLSRTNQREPNEAKSQEEYTPNRDIIVRDRPSQSRPRQFKQKELNEEDLRSLSESELMAFHAFLEKLDEGSEYAELENFDEQNEDVQPDDSSEEDSQTYDSEAAISPDLQEEMFIKYKEIADRMRPIVEEISPIWNRYYELTMSIEEISDLITASSNHGGEEYISLFEEQAQMYEEKAELETVLKPLDERRAELMNEWQDYLNVHHGITEEQFNETYIEDLRLWYKNR